MSYNLIKLLFSVSKDVGGSTPNSKDWKLFFWMEVYPSPDVSSLKLVINKNNYFKKRMYTFSF
jgi:hypothetical protein